MAELLTAATPISYYLVAVCFNDHTDVSGVWK